MTLRAIVTDIEGTTSSLSFVKDVLFPYARRHIADFVRRNTDNPQVQAILDEVRVQIGQHGTVDQIISQLIQWIDQDAKITPLKSLQGLLWEHGYQNGDFTGHIYPDAKQKLIQWHDQGLKLYVYSSGSVYAQKLLFGHTEYGDINYVFSGYFDTLVGSKGDENSYRKIASHLKLQPNTILFLSDIEQELDAAGEAGMQTRWLVREGSIQANTRHVQVNSFDQISFE